MLIRKVQVWIYYYHSKLNQFFFLILLTCPKRGQFWQPVTGSVETDETLESAAVREAHEETGLTVMAAPVWITAFEFQKNNHQWIESGFSLRIEDQMTPPVIQLDPNEHIDFTWVESAEAMKTIAYASNQKVLKTLITSPYFLSQKEDCKTGSIRR